MANAFAVICDVRLASAGRSFHDTFREHEQPSPVFMLAYAKVQMSRVLPMSSDHSLRKQIETKRIVSTPLEDMTSERSGTALSRKSVGSDDIVILDIAEGGQN